MTFKPASLRLTALCAALAASTWIAGCAPIIVGGAVAATTMMATDRRTAGTQVDDESNELRASGAINGVIGDRGHVNVTSYNRVVLLTGEVPTEADKAAVVKAVAQIPTVRSIVNDVAVMPSSSLSTRSNDTVITGKVKAAFVDGKTTFAAVKVVTERGVVYLMGLVTETEATRAVELARAVGGVVKVVRVFQIITPAELNAIEYKASAPAGAASAPAAPAPAPVPAPAPAPTPAAPAATSAPAAATSPVKP